MDGLSELTIQQKVGASLLVIFGVLAISLGGLQLRNQIYTPFAIEPQAQAQKALAEFFNDKEARLRRLDTDKDGLNDYEEINVYNTSRFIKDTDSDGFTDKEEVEQGTDPLCPEGEKCKQESTIETTSESNRSFTVLNEGQQDISKLQQQDLSELSPKQRLKQATEDPDKLRKLLLESGRISKEELEQIDDEQLQETAKNILESNKVSFESQEATSTLEEETTTSQGNINTSNSGLPTDRLKKLIDKPDKLRQLLLQSGKISKEKLQQIDDQTLKETAKKILKRKTN